MKKILLLLTVLLVAFIAVNRERIYLRDPLGAVYRDGVKVEGARVFINYSNDVLVQTGGWTRMAEFVVQGWYGVAGVPGKMRCLQGMACLAEAEHVPMVAVVGTGKATMTNREVTFREAGEGGQGTTVRVSLR